MLEREAVQRYVRWDNEMKSKVHILKYEDVHANAGGHGQPMEFFGRRIAAKWPANFCVSGFH